MNTHALLSILVIALVTALTRFAPFLLFPRSRPTPAFVLYLGRVLPYAVIGMLVVFCLRYVNFGSVAAFLPDFIAVALTALSYAWKRSTLLSILMGLASYMILLRLMV